MKQKTHLLLFFFMCLVKLCYSQQDPQYSQYMFNPLVLNPAYAGSREVLSSVLLYRNQWVNMDGAPLTITASINSPLKKKKTGLGFHVISDKIGPSTTTQYMGSFAYRIRLGQGKLAFGLRAGLYTYRYDWSKVEYKDKADVFNSQTITQYVKPNFDFGLYYYNRSFYSGIAISHLSLSKNNATTQLSEFQNRSALHVVANLGKAFELNKEITFRPSAVVRYTANAPLNIDVNASVLLDERIWLGLGLRSNQDVVIMAEYNITELMRIGYSYDASTRLIRSANKGSHEFFIGFDIDFFKAKTISPRIFKYN